MSDHISVLGRSVCAWEIVVGCVCVVGFEFVCACVCVWWVYNIDYECGFPVVQCAEKSVRGGVMHSNEVGLAQIRKWESIEYSG